ncbi:HTH domain-containing protein [Mollicutes bacterium LVI A0078]|nr:HTH domain-containing protein [Mollicutes bacterium LVI A0075]WOO91824.1 HTH domain-containing protein [Mollicutes bacterium LVI A0078]
MANKKFTQETIDTLRNIDVVTYISETQINFTPDFKVEVAKCKTKYDARQLFKEHNIDIDLTDQSRFDSLYSRFKSQYKNKGVVSFHIGTRGRKKQADKKDL